MPGIHLVRGNAPSVPSVVDPALGTTCFREDYGVDRLTVGDDTVLGYTGYDDYPVRRIDTDDATVLLEGHLYDVEDVRTELRRIADHLAADRLEAASEWLQRRDGDFVVLVHHEGRDEISLLNDAFGRLPVYHATIDGSILLSREMKFLREMAARTGSTFDVDQAGIAQKLLFGYCLGDRTIFEGVRAVPPASLVRIDDDVQVLRLFRHEFETNSYADRSLAENADELAARFASACENRRRDGADDVISLSGGLDSRAVAAAYVDAGVPVTAATYDRGDGERSADARVASTIADVLGVDWQLYEVAASSRHGEQLLDMKQGMNYLGMSFILDFFEQLRSDHGTMTYVTGDGGDKVLVDLTPPRSFSSTGEMVEYIVSEHSRIPLEEAAAVANVDECDIVASVEERIASYPESSFDRKYVHFLVRERAINCLNHGEDRNRYFFWSVSPFYSLPVFRYAMNCPDGQKRGRKLYSAFLERFTPELIDVEYPNFGAPITSMEYRAKRFAFDLVSRYPVLKKPVVKFLVGDGGGEEVVSKIEAQLSRSDLRPLSARNIAEIVGEPNSYRVADLQFLYTMTSIREELGSLEEPEARDRPVQV